MSILLKNSWKVCASLYMEISILATSWGLSLNNKLVFIAWLGFYHREKYYDVISRILLHLRVCSGRLRVKKRMICCKAGSFDYTTKVFQE